MKRTLLFTVFALFGMASANSQQCNYGTVTDNTGMGENASTGTGLEYKGAADFTVPFGTTFSASQVVVNVLKGPADLNYVNIAFSNEESGMPGSVIISFDNLVPVSQELVYTIEEDFDVYAITVNLPETVTLGKGKYFLEMAANPGGPGGAWWEITAQEQTYGVFDFVTFESDPWGGTGYYNKIFQILGNCEDSGETQPDYGTECSQGNANTFHQGGTFFLSESGIVTIADDFVVPENSVFYLTHFNMASMLLGGGFHNATIRIHSSENGQPGAVLHAFENKGPEFEKYNGYFPFPGAPLDVVSVNLDFSFENEPIGLTAGTYFISVTPTPNFAELLTWELKTDPGIGGSSFSSLDGQNWTENTGINQIFTLAGFCGESLGVENPSGQIVSVYPNPVKDVLHISSENAIERISVFDVNGRLVREFANPAESIDMSAFSTGFYVAKIAFANGNSSAIKLAKQ